MANIVFIATSIDGYIADINNGIDWLHTTPNPENSDLGFNLHFKRIDAVIMGRNTYELVRDMDCDWPYAKPVFVLSTSKPHIPTELADKVFPISGDLKQITRDLDQKGFKQLYIDGGITIQHFLKQDLIDEMIITTIPILLGDGIPLFGHLDASLTFKCIKSEQLINALCQSHFVRVENPC